MAGKWKSVIYCVPEISPEQIQVNAPAWCASIQQLLEAIIVVTWDTTRAVNFNVYQFLTNVILNV